MNITVGQQIPANVNDDRDEYRTVFRRQVFELLRRGYKRLDSLSYKHADEEYITGKLGIRIKNIKDANPLKLHADGGWTPVNIIPNFDHCYRSKHDRPLVGKAITVFHVFLSFC
jgi:hypothetical protein